MQNNGQELTHKLVNSVVVNVEKKGQKGFWQVSKTSQIPCFGSRGR